MRNKIDFLKTILAYSWKAFVILLLGFMLTGMAAFYTQQNQKEEAKKEFALICNDLKVVLDTRLHAHANYLRSGAAFFAASDLVNRNNWKVFVEGIKIEKNLPGIQGIGFALIVPKTQLPQHLQHIRQQGFPNYNIKPAGDRNVYTSVIYLEPFAGRNLKAFGYDKLQEPVRRLAMEQSRDNDMAVLSGKVTLVQESNEDIQSGTIMYVPVYKNGMLSNTLQQRRAAITGWVYSPYRMNDLMTGILGRWNLKNHDRIHLQIYDDQVSDGALLYDSQYSDSVKITNLNFRVITVPVAFNGKKWVLYCKQNIEQIPFYKNKAIIILVAGILLSLSLFLLYLSLINTRQKAVAIARALSAEVKETETKFKMLFNGSNDAIFILEGNTIVDCNLKTEFIFTCKRSELIGHGIFDLSPVVQPDGELSAIKSVKIIEAMLADDSQFFEWRYQCPDGRLFDAELGLSKVVINKNVFMQAILRDTTERKKTKENLQIEKQRLALILKGTKAGTWEWNIQTSETIFNERWANIIGYTLEEISPVSIDTWKKYAHPDDLKRSDELLEKHFKGEMDYYECEVRMKHKNGSWVWVLDRGSINEWDADMNPLLMSGIHQDITKRKLAEGIIVESEKRFRLMADTAPVLIWTSGPDTLCNYFNKTWLNFTGKSIEQEMGNGWAEGVHPDDLQGCLDIYLNAFKAQQEFKMEYRLLHVDGTYHWLWDNAVPRFTSDGLFVGYIGSCIDIDKNIQNKKALEDEKSRLALILIGTNAGTWEWNIKTGETIFNERWANMIGYTLEEISPVSIKTWEKFTHPDDLKRSGEILERYFKGEIDYYECEARMKHKNGNWLWVLDRGKVNEWDVEGMPIQMSGTHQDITERKVVEEKVKKYAAELESSNTELENFAYVASHDLQEPLRMVSSFLGLLEKKLEGQLDETGKQYINFVTDGAERMKILINDLLKYARLSTNKDEFCAIDLDDMMTYIVLLQNEPIVKNKATLNIKPLPEITGNKALINELFMNLINNALKYRGEKDPEIEVGYTEEKELFRFYVQDNGIGIKPEDFDKIFILFQRLHAKSQYSGTGIGLALCKKIVDIHKGKIGVESVVGKGSTFYFTIPK